MPKPADLNRCLAPLDQDHTIIAVIEMSQSSWLVAGIVPGIARHPLKKLAPDQDALLNLLHRWREEAGQAGRKISRIALAFEAGRDGFWLARWLRAHGVEAHVIHPSSVAVSREHRRASLPCGLGSSLADVAANRRSHGKTRPPRIECPHSPIARRDHPARLH